MGFLGACIATLISMIIYLIIKEIVANSFVKIDYPYLKISFVFFILIGISLAVPVTYFYFNTNIHFIFKILLVIATGVLLITTKFLQLNDFLKLFSRVIRIKTKGF